MSNIKQKKGFHEYLRRMIVSLKRKPQTFAMILLVVAFLVYSLNLTHISDSTAKIQGRGMGFSGFVTMLFSLLSFVCFLNAFPHRKKPNILMLILFFLMMGCIIYCDYFYSQCIVRAITRADHPIVVDQSTQYINQAKGILQTHIVLIALSAIFTLLTPVFGKLLRRIDTSLPIEETQNMEAIELTES